MHICNGIFQVKYFTTLQIKSLPSKILFSFAPLSHPVTYKCKGFTIFKKMGFNPIYFV